jgi:KaiC/GvpD/RAD55 family RecA-like ATPase
MNRILPEGIKHAFLEDCGCLKPYEWTIKGLIPTNGITVLYGASGSGKTFATTHMALCVASGSNFLGHKVKRKGKVIYIAAESPESIKRRMAIMRDFDKVAYGDYEFDGKEISIYDGNIDLLGDPHAMIAAIRAFHDRVLDDGEVVMVIIDTLSAAFSGLDENSVEMAMAVKNAKLIQEELRCAVVIIHHTGKDEDRGLRGHSSLRGNVEQAIQISGMRNPRQLIVDKVKDEQFGDKCQFDLIGINIGLDEEGEPMSGCLVQLAAFDAINRATKQKLTDAGRVALKVFNESRGTSVSVNKDIFKKALQAQYSHLETKHLSTYVNRGITQMISRNYIALNEMGEYVSI